jgi:hypothetical protein
MSGYGNCDMTLVCHLGWAKNAQIAETLFLSVCEGVSGGDQHLNQG